MRRGEIEETEEQIEENSRKLARVGGERPERGKWGGGGFGEDGEVGGF